MILIKKDKSFQYFIEYPLRKRTINYFDIYIFTNMNNKINIYLLIRIIKAIFSNMNN